VFRSKWVENRKLNANFNKDEFLREFLINFADSCSLLSRIKLLPKVNFTATKEEFVEGWV